MQNKHDGISTKERRKKERNEEREVKGGMEKWRKENRKKKQPQILISEALNKTY